MTMTNDEQGTEIEPRPFAAFLQELRGGVVHSDLTHELAHLVDLCRIAGKPGSLTLVLTVKPQNGQMFVTDDVRVKPPKSEAPLSIWFADEAGNLLREDPNRPQIPGLREVPPMPAPRSADTGS